MTSKVKRNKINFKGKTVNIGIDMHKISWRITARVEGDTVLAITLARPTYVSFKKILSQFKGITCASFMKPAPGDSICMTGLRMMGSSVSLHLHP